MVSCFLSSRIIFAEVRENIRPPRVVVSTKISLGKGEKPKTPLLQEISPFSKSIDTSSPEVILSTASLHSIAGRA